MTRQVLTTAERCLVGVAASVGAGCVPCGEYHVEKARGAGATREEVQAAVAVAAAVRREATSDIERRVLGQVDEPGDAAPHARSSTRDAEAIWAAAAAFSASSQALTEQALERSLALGIPPDALREALEVAGSVRRMAATIVERQADRLLGAPDPAATKGQSDAACRCS